MSAPLDCQIADAFAAEGQYEEAATLLAWAHVRDCTGSVENMLENSLRCGCHPIYRACMLSVLGMREQLLAFALSLCEERDSLSLIWGASFLAQVMSDQKDAIADSARSKLTDFREAKDPVLRCHILALRGDAGALLHAIEDLQSKDLRIKYLHIAADIQTGQWKRPVLFRTAALQQLYLERSAVPESLEARA